MAKMFTTNKKITTRKIPTTRNNKILACTSTGTQDSL